MKLIYLYFKLFNLYCMEKFAYRDYIIDRPDYEPGLIAYRVINIAYLKTKRQINK